jgi:hypothetical protein
MPWFPAIDRFTSPEVARHHQKGWDNGIREAHFSMNWWRSQGFAQCSTLAAFVLEGIL